MSNVRATFLECLKAVEKEFRQGKVQVQGNARVVNLGPDVVPGQADEARITAGGILGLVEGMMAKNKEETPVQGLEEYQLKIMDLEGRVIMLRKELVKEKDAGIIKDNKLKELQEELQKEKDQKLIQGELLIEKQREVKVEKEARIAAQEELSKKELELKKVKDLVTILEKEKIETNKVLKKAQEELRKKQIELENEMKVRVKLEQECAELTAELNKGAAQEKKSPQTAQQAKPKLTDEEQEKYGKELLDASSSGDVSTVRRLLSLGVNCDVRDVVNCTPLHRAARSGQADTCQLLLDAAPALVNVRDDGNWTPLHWAAMCGHLSVVRLLVLRGADRGLRDIGCRTALDWAVSNNYKQVADYLTQLT